MPVDSGGGGLSKEEFMLVQNQLLELRNKNYELQEELRRKNAELQNNSSNSPRNEALQFASKLINRGKSSEKYEVEIDGLRRKLATQEEEFRLQQQTLFEEMNKLAAQNEALKSGKEVGNDTGQASEELKDQLEGKSADLEKLQKRKGEFLEKKLMTDLEDKLLDYKKTMENGEKDVLNLKEKLKEAENRNLEIKDKLENLQREHDQLKMISSEEIATSVNLSETVTQLQLTIQDLEEKLEGSNFSKEQQNLYENALEEKDLKIRTLTEEIGLERDNREELKLQLKNFEEGLILQGEQFEEEIANLSENSNLKSRRKAQIPQKSKRMCLKKTIEERDLEIKALTQEIGSERDNREELKLQLKNFEEGSLLQREQFEKKIADNEKRHSETVQALENRLKDERLEVEKLEKEVEELVEKAASENEKQLEGRALLLESRFKLEIDDQKRDFEKIKEELERSVTSLQEQLKSKDAEKQLAVKKQSAMMKELQKALRDERKRADSLEKKSEEKTGWHVVSDNDGNSSHKFDGNESVSSFSAIESENVELITRLATLQRLHSENVDRLLFLESENSRLKREVEEKGELIENWIRDRPVGFGNTPNSTPGATPQRQEGGFRRLLNVTLGNEGTSDVREMNKKLQRMLEETLSKNIILQRDLQTLLERTEI
ncbi:unnamed protein product [Caenorhabditis auriculariae]|uniref:GRIP1-associated protein 1 n=1 Tax=Caenorhabditis auriculariae TaxID=2777116 RepID=A0A8S1H612_9PELO|nr:unnamed protein product [Caenorhabditis auriculariae]